MQQFFVLMVDYGRDGQAIVNPEETRAGIVKEVRDILANPRGREIAFIWNVRAGEVPEDITSEIIAEAQQEREPASWEEIGGELAALQDHARDLRKHSETV